MQFFNTDLLGESKMTKLKKALWYIAGIVPFGTYIIIMVNFRPLNYYNGVVRQQFGLAIWIMLSLLQTLLYILLGVWSSYCFGRSKSTAKLGWQGYLEQFRTEKKGILIFLGIAALILISNIFYKPL